MTPSVTIIADSGASGALAFTRSTLADFDGPLGLDVRSIEPQGILDIAAGADSLYALAALDALTDPSRGGGVVVRSGTAFLRPPERLMEFALGAGVAAPQRTLPLGDEKFEPSVRAIGVDGLGIADVIAAADGGQDMLREVALSARRDLEAFRFDAPYLQLSNLAAYGRQFAFGEPAVVDAAWLGDGVDLTEDNEIVALRHWRPDRAWVPDGRQFFPRVTALGRPALQRLLDERSAADRLHGPDERDRDALRDLARTLLIERVDVDAVSDASAAEFESWLAEPADVPSLRMGIPRGLHLVWSVRQDLRRAFPDVPGEDEARLLEWGKHDPHWAGIASTRLLVNAGSCTRRTLPGIGGVAESVVRRERAATQDGVLVFGLLNAANGLGNVARDLVHTLKSVSGGATVSLRTWDTTARAKVGAALHEGPPRSTAIAVHGAQEDFADLVDRDFLRADRRIGVVFWEIDCPIPGVEDFERVYTELWAPSGFLAGVYRNQTSLPVHVMPQHAEFQGSDDVEDTLALRAAGEPYALFTFDHYSVMERKNPTGVIDAFVASFGPDDGVRLIIKSINGDRYRRPHAELVRRASKHPHVEVRDGFLPRSEVLRLAAGASAYVSLHRGEGLGLTIAEAMAMGVPAVATAYGGNLDFMRDGNCYLVDWETVEVGDEGFPYPHDATWANPDVHLAADAIRRAITDDMAATLGTRGREDVLAAFDRGRQVGFLRQQGVA